MKQWSYPVHGAGGVTSVNWMLYRVAAPGAPHSYSLQAGDQGFAATSVE